MRPTPVFVLLGGVLWSVTATAQDSNANYPGSNPSKLVADPLAPGPLTVAPPPLHGPSYGEGTTDEFMLTYHGYLSAPILVGIGSKQGPGANNPNQSGTPLHSLYLNVPDYTYNTWLVTNEEPGAWASMNFSIGTSKVFGSVYMGGWDFSQGQQTPQNAAHAQLALSSFMPSLTIRLDNIFDSKTRLDAVFGGVRDRYGGSGKWDYGAYGATVIGATVAIGETIALERQFGGLRLRVEEGFGGNGHPITDPRGTTMLAHGHVIANYKDDLFKGGLHYITTFTADERTSAPGGLGVPSNGSISVSGADMRFNGGIYGELFVGGSYVKVNQAQRVDGTLQVVHVAGGQAMMDNFLTRSTSGTLGASGDYGTGSLRNVLVQYDYSFGTLARYPEDFWGNGPDLKVQLFGLYTKVHSADPAWDNQDKLKFGAKLIYSPLNWLAAAMRFDRVIPNMNTDPAAGPGSAKELGQNFSVLSTRLTFRTSFVAHETVDLQYSRYFYPSNGAQGVPQLPNAYLLPTNPSAGQQAAGGGYPPGSKPYETDVVSIAGTMWF